MYCHQGLFFSVSAWALLKFVEKAVCLELKQAERRLNLEKNTGLNEQNTSKTLNSKNKSQAVE